MRTHLLKLYSTFLHNTPHPRPLAALASQTSEISMHISFILDPLSAHFLETVLITKGTNAYNPMAKLLSHTM